MDDDDIWMTIAQDSSMLEAPHTDILLDAEMARLDLSDVAPRPSSPHAFYAKLTSQAKKEGFGDLDAVQKAVQDAMATHLDRIKEDLHTEMIRQFFLQKVSL